MSGGTRKILVLDDLLAIEEEVAGHPSKHSFLRDVGGDPGDFEFSTAWDRCTGGYTAEAALNFIRHHRSEAALLLLDVRFEHGSPGGRAGDLGRVLLPIVREQCPGLPVVMMTTEKPENSGREYVRLGAVDCLVKPLEKRRFWRTVRRYLGLDPSSWLIGQHDLYQGAVCAAAVLGESGQHLIIQGGSDAERTAFAEYLLRCSGRERICSIDVREQAEEALSNSLFGRKVRSWEKSVAASPESLLAQMKGGILRLLAVDVMPRGLQGALANFLASQSQDQDSVLVVGETTGGLARLAQEDRFDRELFELLNGSQPVNIPRLEVLGGDLLLRLSSLHGTRTDAGAAFDDLDEAAFEAAMGHVSISGFDQWYANVQDNCERLAGKPLRSCMAPVAADFLHAGNSLPVFSEEMLEQGGHPILFDLRRRELGLLVSAYAHARGNRARAAKMLNDGGKGRVSTIHFDRWFQRVWKEFTFDERSEMYGNPEVCEICRVLGIDQ